MIRINSLNVNGFNKQWEMMGLLRGAGCGVHGRHMPANAAFAIWSLGVGSVSSVRRWLGWAALGLVIGLGVGFAAGWWWWPVEYTNTTPSTLHQRYQDEYVLMTAAAFEVDEDAAQAGERLSLIAPDDPALPVVQLAERLIETEGDSAEIARLARLAQVLGATSSALRPYVEGAP